MSQFLLHTNSFLIQSSYPTVHLFIRFKVIHRSEWRFFFLIKIVKREYSRECIVGPPVFPLAKFNEVNLIVQLNGHPVTLGGRVNFILHSLYKKNDCILTNLKQFRRTTFKLNKQLVHAICDNRFYYINAYSRPIQSLNVWHNCMGCDHTYTGCVDCVVTSQTEVAQAQCCFVGWGPTLNLHSFFLQLL